MTMTPFLETPLYVQFHAASALLAIIIGPFALYGPRGSVHKIMGYSWVIAMAVTALSSFWISGFALIGPFSPLHLLAVLVLASLFKAIRDARAGRITAHQRTMQNLYWTGLVVAGLFTLLPGRMMNRMIFDQAPDLGFVVIGIGGAALVIALLRPYVVQAQTAE